MFCKMSQDFLETACNSPGERFPRLGRSRSMTYFESLTDMASSDSRAERGEFAWSGNRSRRLDSTLLRTLPDIESATEGPMRGHLFFAVTVRYRRRNRNPFRYRSRVEA